MVQTLYIISCDLSQYIITICRPSWILGAKSPWHLQFLWPLRILLLLSVHELSKMTGWIISFFFPLAYSYFYFLLFFLPYCFLPFYLSLLSLFLSSCLPSSILFILKQSPHSHYYISLSLFSLCPLPYFFNSLLFIHSIIIYLLPYHQQETIYFLSTS